MQYFYAAIFGIFQGLTEFLPVSSSGHLLILHQFLKIPLNNEMAFDVILHLSTLIAVIIFFRSEIKNIFLNWLKTFSNIKEGVNDLGWLIILATIPGALFGFLFEEEIDTVFRSPILVAAMLAVVGLLFILVEKMGKQTGEVKNLNWKKTLLIGISQAIALIPGTSRSGITTITGMSLKLKREEAIKFSFLLSIPIIAGATVKELPQLFKGLAVDEAGVLIIAFVFALFSSIFAIKYFLSFSKNHTLNVFAYYRFILAAVILILFL